jgi:hypothetical protein
MLTISRSDVSSVELQEFDVSQRFIKLPIASYLQLLGLYDTLNAPQLALINAVNNPKYRFVCAALARRLGKTYIANVIAQLVLLVPGCNILIMSPNYSLSSISFELQRKLIRHFDLEVARDNLKDKLLELENGSTIRMGSISTVDSSVGRSYDLIIFDEAALASGGEAAFNVALRPTLDKPNAKAIFISTPRGRNNWFSEFYQRGFSDNFPEWISLTADYTENPRMSVSDVEAARRSMSRAEFAQEYCASFTEFEGQIYAFSNTCVESWIGLDCEVFAGIDPGYRDPTAVVVVAYVPSRDCYWVLDEYCVSNATTQQHAVAIKALLDRYGCGDAIFIDSAAAQFAADLAYQYDIPTIKAKKDVLAGIAWVQSIVEGGRLIVDPKCVGVLAMLDQYRWDTNDSLHREKPVHDKHSHLADALRYALYSFTI